jgi:hypothetical protein
MRRIVIAACLAVLLVPASAAEAEAKPCPKRGVVAENVKARLYIVSREDGEHRLRGCMKRSHKRTLLSAWTDCDCSTGDLPTPQYALTGRIAAVNEWSCSPFEPGECGGATTVTDLKSRAPLRTIATDGSVSDLVVTRKGNAAVIGPNGLQRADGGGVTTLDPAPDAGSLAHAPGTATLYWTTAGLPRSAPLD